MSFSEKKSGFEEAYHELKRLKEQQDGDYFLTSLLIDPLLCNNVESESVSIDFFIHQKKQFQFRTRKAQIGGDVCIAHSISLRGKSYTVFLNGDAMGKSLQGAGGALVLSVVFNSYVNRMRTLSSGRRTYPEKWLKSCYEELQSIFISFDGSMLVSVVVGLLDDETGLLYYFNAEHPWNVLYRNKKAYFMEDSLETRKIGIEDLGGEFKLKILQLREKDVVFIGSDGRDDLLLGHDKGSRIINEDENLFLGCVEESKGDLKFLVELLEKNGELTDDLSLIRIAYKENENKEEQEKLFDFCMKKKAEALFKEKKGFTDESIALYLEALKGCPDKEIYSKLLSFYEKKGMLKDEAKILESAMRHFPINLKIILRASIVNKKLKNYDLAADCGERFRAHDPNNMKNLVNLIDVYRLMENFNRARVLLEMAKKININYEGLDFLINLIEKKSVFF